MQINAKLLMVPLGIIIMSLFYFPFIFKAIPIVNTKQVLAVLGLVLIIIRLSEGDGIGKGLIPKDFFLLVCYALLVSLAGFFTITVNGTSDYAYATYIVSFIVWISAAYAVYSFLKYVHGAISIPLIANYIIGVCVLQCICAIWIDFSPTLKLFVDTIIEQNQDFLNASNVERLYGIGASVDVAGIRFSIALILIAYLAIRLETTIKNKYLFLYLLAFAIITILGNMVARTTSVGVLIGFLYLFISSWNKKIHLAIESRRLWKWIVIALFISIPIAVYSYNHNEVIHHHMRFAFEGFFNLIEKGKWETTSTDKLRTMYVFPETLKTWIMGDGYFSNPRDVDPYFIGKYYGGYYMGTDVGYLRFIFYFGVIGLAMMANFLIQACRTCYNRFEGTRILFLMILVANFIIWFKVSTDIFLVFALFLCVSKEENEEYMHSISLEMENSKGDD